VPGSYRPFANDNGVIMARHGLLRAAKALVEKGTVPPGVDPEDQKVRSAAIVLPRDRPYQDAAKEHLRVRVGAVHASV
jgi:phthalate 4,5-dioxygenase